MRYAVAAMIFVLAGGLFLWQFSQLEQPAPIPEPAPIVAPTEQQENQNPFGEGSEAVGEDGSVSEDELATHNTESDCWVGYKGIVYDITDWLPRHPGSAGAIAPYCGTVEEFTAAFSKQHGTKRDAKLEKEGEVQGNISN